MNMEKILARVSMILVVTNMALVERILKNISTDKEVILNLTIKFTDLAILILVVSMEEKEKEGTVLSPVPG
jgi:hypothetical protein